MHMTTDLDDGYLGSGNLIKRAIKKYGVGNFTKRYLAVFNNFEEMVTKEAEVVNEEFIARDDTYNIMLGGSGSWFYVNTIWGNADTRSDRAKNGALAANALGANHTGGRVFLEKMNNPEFKEAWHAKLVKHNARAFAGKSHSDETRLKMQSAHRGKHTAEKNSNYGKRWMCRGNDKPISADIDMQRQLLEAGWIYGRKAPPR